MKLNLLFLGFLMILSNTASGQHCKDFMNSAISSICKKDTQSYLNFLRKSSRACKDTGLLSASYILQSIIYEGKMEYDSSIILLKRTLEIYQGPIQLNQFRDRCNWIYYTFEPYLSINESWINRSLANVYMKKLNFNEAIACLNLIDKNGIPGYNGCVNGAISIETSLAMQYSDCYLGLGDTVSAINCLVDYAFYNEGEMSKKLIVQLKKLLLSRYSKAEISREIEHSIMNVKEIKSVDRNGFESSRVELVLFGRKIPALPFSLIEFRTLIQQNQNLEYLKE